MPQNHGGSVSNRGMALSLRGLQHPDLLFPSRCRSISNALLRQFHVKKHERCPGQFRQSSPPKFLICRSRHRLSVPQGRIGISRKTLRDTLIPLRDLAACMRFTTHVRAKRFMPFWSCNVNLFACPFWSVSRNFSVLCAPLSAVRLLLRLFSRKLFVPHPLRSASSFLLSAASFWLQWRSRAGPWP